ncbi:hypothetical protein FBEOM_729 [Fusarium beomiforme]|uniref:Uncharacterized protein n=1 Tax=Fusarium beomiforme TaxID=44412 RepID=A0A9P5AVD3_9HYPO|nr:hypothetical protein FBEOM_729 [Fusarium beomiforme]
MDTKVVKDKPAEDRPPSGTNLEDFASDGVSPTSRPRAQNDTETLSPGRSISQLHTEQPTSRQCSATGPATPILASSPPPPPYRDKDDFRVPVGKWNQTLPKSDSKRKKEEGGDEDDNDESPEKSSPRKLTKRDKARLCDAPAYLAIGLSDNGASKVLFQYKDDSGQMATSEYIDWDTTSDVKALKRRALAKRERNERDLIRDFNKKRLTITARNYIIEAAAAGFTEGCRPSIASPQVIELAKPVSTLDAFEKVTRENMEIIEELRTLLGRK